MTLRVGIIGATGRGGYGHSIDLSFGRIEEAEVVAVADADLVGAKKSQERTGAHSVYQDYREMLERERLDVVAICPRWCDQRLEMVLHAVEAGVKGILCEKPMAPTLAEADRIVAACEANGVRMAVAHRRVSGYEIYAKDLLEQGVIGELRAMRGYGKGDHRAGAEDFAVLGTHILDSMRYFAGSEVAWAHGHVTQDGREVTPDDVREGAEGIGYFAGNGVNAYYAFENGVTATFESHPADRPGSRRFGLDLYGTKGIIALRDSPRGEMYLYPSGTWMPSPDDGEWKRLFLDSWEMRPDGTPRSGKEWTRESNHMIAREIVDAILEERELQGVSTAADARAALEMIHAVHASSIRKARVYFPLDDRENPYRAWADERSGGVGA